MAERVIELALTLCALPVAAIALYLFTLAALSWRRRAPAYGAPRRRFDIVIPAHDEETGIARTVASLLAVDYPASLRRIRVIADNCSDRTADVAGLAGAEVLVRDDRSRRGKGYALQFAFGRSLEDGFADAVVVVDADTAVSPNLLTAFAARLEAGALVVQAKYGVLNASASWRTRLMAIAFSLFNDVRSIARERLRLSTGLRGNGMCFAIAALRAVPHDAFSVVEDLEYGIRLGEAGYRVHYAEDTEVRGLMVASAAASRSQRVRWEGGRLKMMRERGLPLLGRGLRRGDRVVIDLAIDLLVPPLSFVVLAAIAGLTVALAGSLAAGHPLAALYPWLFCVGALCAYVIRGWWISGTGLRGIADLLGAPFFVAWKVALLLRRPRGPVEWVRTTRETQVVP